MAAKVKKRFVTGAVYPIDGSIRTLRLVPADYLAAYRSKHEKDWRPPMARQLKDPPREFFCRKCGDIFQTDGICPHDGQQLREIGP